MEVLPHNLRYIKKTYMKRFLHLMAWIALAMLTFASCAEKFESDPAKPEAYMKYFSLNEIDSEDWGYLDVSVKERISRADVEKHIVGGWKSVAIYELDKNKSIVATKKLKSDLPASSEEPLVDYFEIKGFGKNQLIQYGLLEGRYENLDFAYDESDNSLSLDACWHVAHNGKLVYLSDGIMVCVDAKRWGTEEKPLVYMVVFEKVSDSTLGEWRKECPAGGLWV